VRPAAAGTFSFAPPDGQPVPAARALPGVDDGDPGQVVVDPDTGRLLRAIDRWGHDDLDLDTALAVLHQELARWVSNDLAVAA
jgi:hypothetical protein